MSNPHGAFYRNYNRFGSLNYEIECYKCNNFGHTARNYNIFGALKYEIECYKCNNFGHTTRNCRSRFTGSLSLSKENRKVPEQQTIWKISKKVCKLRNVGLL